MSAEPRGTPDADTITVEESDGWYVAKDEETGVASQGRTKAKALSNLAEALELHDEDVEAEPELERSDAPWFDR